MDTLTASNSRTKAIGVYHSTAYFIHSIFYQLSHHTSSRVLDVHNCKKLSNHGLPEHITLKLTWDGLIRFVHPSQSSRTRPGGRWRKSLVAGRLLFPSAEHAMFLLVTRYGTGRKIGYGRLP